MPSTSLHSLVEYRPFVGASWSVGLLDLLDFLIEPRSGFTRHLQHRSQTRQDPYCVLFSRPHGRSIPVGESVVLIVASGYRIAAQLAYLKQLLHGCI